MKVEYCPEDNCWDTTTDQWRCRNARRQITRWNRTLGIRGRVDSAVVVDDRIRENLRRAFATELAASCPSDAGGVKREMPVHADFEIHTRRCIDGSSEYAVLYSGDRDPMDLLAEQPAKETASESAPQDDAMVDCHLTHPVGKDAALAWASTAEWFFKNYYKYDFTFESSGFLAMPDEHEAHEFTATATVGGDAPEIYRFKVEDSEPMSWDEISHAGIPHLTICGQDGTVLITVAGDEARPEADDRDRR